jgi:di/tricarboxylate transporter
LDSPAVVTVAVLIVTVGLLTAGRLRADLVALLSAVVLGLTGVLTSQETFSGFSRSAVITIVAVFVLAEALRRTGATERAGNYLLRLSGSRESSLVMLAMAAGAFLSLFMNNIAAASVLLPAVSDAGRKAGVSPSRLLMPLAFGTIVGGMATLLTTANIVISSLLRDRGIAGYGLLDFAPLGLPMVGLGLAYVAVAGRHLLPTQSPAERLQMSRVGEQVDLVDVYRLGERLFRARIPRGSTLIDQPLARSSLREIYHVTAVAIERNDTTILAPSPHDIVKEGDIILFAGRLEDFRERDTEPYLEILPADEWRVQDLESPTVMIAEAVLAPRSGLIGRTLREANFREKYGMTVLAIWRGSRQMRTGLAEMPLQFGDALLLQGPCARLRVLQTEPDLILLTDLREEQAPPTGRRQLALGILGTTLLLAALYPSLVGEIMLGGALAMVLIGVLNMDQVYQAIEWRTVFLVAGLLPLGIAMTKTGIANSLADSMVSVLGPAGPLALVAGLSLLALLLVQVINTAAVAAVVAPIAIQTAQHIGADPRAVAMGVALATSMTFLTPLGHPVNILVMGPGGYRFRDYFKVGMPLTVLLFGAMMLLLPVFWPLSGP